jgi:hypothetical protein
MGSPGTHPCESVHQLQESFHPHCCESYHTEPLLLHCCLLYGGGLNMVMTQGAAVELPQHPVVACDTSYPRKHHGHARHPVPGWLISDMGNEHPSHQWVLPQSQLYYCFLRMGRFFTDAVCRVCCMDRSLTGSPVVVSVQWLLLMLLYQ